MYGLGTHLCNVSKKEGGGLKTVKFLFCFVCFSFSF